MLTGLLQLTVDWDQWRIQSVQNAAARLVTNTRRCEHITPIERQLHWLPVRQRIRYKLTTAPSMVRASTWLPQWRLSAHGRLSSMVITIIRTLSLYCTTLQHHVRRMIIRCSWPTSVERLAQRSTQHQTFNWHFSQASQNAIVLWGCSAFVTVWFLCPVFKCFLLTYLSL